MNLPPHNLTVTITGLILMKTRADGSLAGHVMEVEGHRPLMSFRAVDVLKAGELGATDRPIGVDADGEELVELDIEADVLFDFEKPIGVDELATNEEPAGHVDLSGIASATDMGLSGLDDRGLDACRKVMVPAGAMVSAGAYALSRDTGEPLLWGFFPEGASVSAEKGKYLSNKVVISRKIPVARHVVVKMGKISFALAPPRGGDVAISISNVPSTIDYSKKSSTKHVRHYASVYATKPADVRLPEVLKGGATKPGGICPPGDGDG